jgi:hypothetical protein
VSHVINITPNCIQRKVILCVFLNDCLQILNFVIAPSALVKA